MVQQWDLGTCRMTASTRLAAHAAAEAFGGASRNPTGLAYVFSLAARGRVLATTLSDGTCRLLDALTCREVAKLDVGLTKRAAVFAAAFSPTSTALALADAEGGVMIFDVRSYGKPLVEHQGAHARAVNGVCFAPAGALAASLLSTAAAPQRGLYLAALGYAVVYGVSLAVYRRVLGDVSDDSGSAPCSIFLELPARDVQRIVDDMTEGDEV